MRSQYLERLSDVQKKDLESTLFEQQNGKCFICGDPVDLKIHQGSLDIDHVEPTSTSGKDDPSNFALTHASCNRSKQASDLRVARILARFDKIRKKIITENRGVNLGDILHEYDGASDSLSLSIDNDTLRYSLPNIGINAIVEIPVFEDPLSQFRYTFMNLPIAYLHHDDKMNPRSIGSNIRKLIEEFYKKRPQLHVSLAWLNTEGEDSNRVYVFDGQHKAAAQVLLGAKSLPIRVFLNPDLDTLLTTNTNAGTTLRQVAFDKSVQRSLGSSLLADRLDRYRTDHNLPEDCESFSEKDLVNHFKGERREMKRYVIDWVRHSITHNSENKMKDYVDYGGRGSEMPFSYSSIEKTFYSFFIYGELLTTPFSDHADEGENPRHLEVSQIVHLMNIIAEKLYIGYYDYAIGTRRIENKLKKDEDVPDSHVRACRMAREEILHNWLRYTKQIIHNYFITVGQPIDENRLFQVVIPKEAWNNVSSFINNLGKLPIWVNKELSLSAFGGKHDYGYWHEIFRTGKSPDGQSIMPQGINLMEMITNQP